MLKKIQFNFVKILKRKSNTIFFVFLFLYITFQFINVFKINFFSDDYFFLRISKAKNIIEFLNFYSPFREYSYKPLGGETFYFIIQSFKNSIFIGHLITLITYFIGLIFFYKILFYLTRNNLFSKLVVFLYGISFIHIFQIYWFATFQEVALLTFLTISFYKFLKNKYVVSILFYILACLCKETAVLYAPFLLLFVIFYSNCKKISLKKNLIPLFIIFLITFIFYIFFRFSLNYVTKLDNYKMVWDLKLLFNNAIWYFLWSIGFPNFMPDYFRSILSKPLPAFWQNINTPTASIYFYSLIIYLLGLLSGLICLLLFQINKKKEYILIIIYCLFNFFVFLGPILFFRHKWMIRLTLPLVFISIIEAFILYLLLNNKNKFLKFFAVILISLYIVWNFSGTKLHEETSIYLLESRIYNNSLKYFNNNYNEILKYKAIYIYDITHNLPKGWNGSEKLKTSFSDNNYVDYFFPDSKIKTIYGFENKMVPKDSYILQSDMLLK